MTALNILSTVVLSFRFKDFAVLVKDANFTAVNNPHGNVVWSQSSMQEPL